MIPSSASTFFKSSTIQKEQIQKELNDYKSVLSRNELLKIKLKGETIFGYYNGFDRDRGSFNILLHDRQDGKDHKQGLIRKGIKTAISITKYDVDVLGNYYLSKPEKRLELA